MFDKASGGVGVVKKSHHNEALQAEVETRIVRAAWTLRRCKDPEQGWLSGARAFWPQFKVRQHDFTEDQTSFEARMNARLTKEEIGDMQPALDLLLMLPDLSDRKLVFAIAWHFNGEVSPRIYWEKVEAILSAIDPANRYNNCCSRTLKRNYRRSIGFIAACVALEAG